MLSVLFDDLTVIVLAVSAIFFAPFKEALLISAGLLLVAITASSMGSKLRLMRLPVLAAFAVSGGSFMSFASFALIKEIKQPYRAALGFVSYLIYSAARMGIEGSGSSESFAMHVLYGFLLILIMTVIMAAGYFIDSQKKKIEKEAEKLKNANLSELHEKQLNRELIKQQFLAEKNARLLERENISRNIHNSVGHSITAAIMTLDAADMLYDKSPDEARKRMNDANERIRGSLENIRRAVRTLDEEGNPVSVSDLIGDMNGIMDEFVLDSKIDLDRLYKTEDTSVMIPHEHAEFLTGVLSEMLTNGVKHGNADRFLVILSGDHTHLRLSVSDNGKTDFNEKNSAARIEKGFGLKKMISYAARFGGKTEFTNDDGFRAVVELPLTDLSQGDKKQ